MSKHELNVIESIYCRPGELTVHTVGDDINSNTVFTVTLTHVRDSPLSTMNSTRMFITVAVGYPETVPNIIISSDAYSKQQCKEMQDTLLDHASGFLGRPMLLDLIVWLQDYLQGVQVSDKVSVISESSLSSNQDVKQRHDVSGSGCDDNVVSKCTALLHIDHMRRQSAYVKTLTAWANEMRICGQLIFLNRLILVLLHGTMENIKEFILRLRTVNVDVDSHGRSCKERMMTVLCSPYPDRQCCVAGFTSQRLQSVVELKDLFTLNGLSQLYAEHVCHLTARLT